MPVPKRAASRAGIEIVCRRRRQGWPTSHRGFDIAGMLPRHRVLGVQVFMTTHRRGASHSRRQLWSCCPRNGLVAVGEPVDVHDLASEGAFEWIDPAIAIVETTVVINSNYVA